MLSCSSRESVHMLIGWPEISCKCAYQRTEKATPMAKPLKHFRSSRMQTTQDSKSAADKFKTRFHGATYPFLVKYHSGLDAGMMWLMMAPSLILLLTGGMMGPLTNDLLTRLFCRHMQTLHGSKFVWKKIRNNSRYFRTSNTTQEAKLFRLCCSSCTRIQIKVYIHRIQSLKTEC